jgi:thiamine pyrophosphokinase
MRTLIVADSPSALSVDELLSIASAADFVIAADGGAAKCLRATVVPDLVVGDLDSLDAESERELRHRAVLFVTVPADKDVSDLDIAVREARALGADSLVVVGALGGRVDHELAGLGTLARAADLSPELVAPGAVALVLSPLGRPTASVTGPAPFSLVPLLGVARVSCAGARWMLTNELLEPISSLGLSNRVPEGSVAEITVHEGVVLLYLP